jgi:protein-tyrosine-phosphatase
MAASIAQKMYPEKFIVESAGIAPYGENAASEAIEVMQSEYCIDISRHQTQSVTSLSLGNFDYIIALDPYVFDHLKIYFQIAQEKLIKWDIDDPFTEGIEVFRECARNIQTCMKNTLDALM